MTVFDDFCSEFQEQDKRWKHENEIWMKWLKRLRQIYWNNPRIKDAIYEAEQSIN